MNVAISAPDTTSFMVCLLRITRDIPTIIVMINHSIPKSGLLEKNKAATKRLKAVCMELLIK